MNCTQAHDLFDSHVDGELAATLETELLAHLVECGSCRRALALLEVAGHVVRSDEGSEQLTDSFTDRLLACMDEQPTSSVLTLRKVMRWSLVGLGAAAAVALAVGTWSGKRSLVAGSHEQVVPQTTNAPVAAGRPTTNPDEPKVEHLDRTGGSGRAWERFEEVPAKGSPSLEEWSSMSIMQLLKALGIEEAPAAAGREPLAPPLPSASNSDDSRDVEVEEF